MGLFTKIHARWSESRDKDIFKMCRNSLKSLGKINNMLDVGAGDGTWTKKVVNIVNPGKVYGVEIYEPFIKKLENVGINVIEQDLNILPWDIKDKSFDLVVSNQVIEHVIYPVGFLKEVYRILRWGGEAVISTENLASWDNVGSLILGYLPFSMELDHGLKLGNPLSPHYREDERGGYPPHLRIFTLSSFIEMCEYVGFEVLEVSGNGHLFGKVGEIFDKRHSRFMTVRVRKV